MSLLPKRGLSYTGVGDLTFVDERSICYPFGSRIWIHNLDPDEGDGDGVFLGSTAEVSTSNAQPSSSFCTITAMATSWREGRVALATAGVVSPSIVLYSYPDRKERGRLDGNCLYYNSIAFSRGGDRIVAFGNHSDTQIVVWAVIKEESSTDEDEEYKLTGQKLISTSLRGNTTFCDFNPVNKNHIVTGGESGLVLWNTVDLEDEWHITCKQITGVENSVISSISLGYDTKSPFTCHAWGNYGMLWVGLRKGEIQCFNSKDSCTTDQQPLHKSYLGSHSTPAGLIYTRGHIIVGTEEGNVYWYSLPSQCDPLSLVFSVALEGANNQNYRVSKIAYSPIFDQFVVGTKDGVLLSLPLEHSKQKEGAVNMTELSACHSGVVLCCVSFCPFDLSAQCFNVHQNVIATGGEDGYIRLCTVDHGKLCGLRQFLQQEDTTTTCCTKTKAGDDSLSIHGTVPSSMKKVVPVTVLASSLHFPLVAAGLCNGVVHVLFQRIDIDRKVVRRRSSIVASPSNQVVSLITIWQERLYGGGQLNKTSVSILEFHPTEALLAVASSGDSMLHVVDVRFSERRPFRVCAYASSPHDEGGNITSLMWRNNDIIFTTSTKLICCVDIDMSTEAAEHSRPSTLKWVLQTSIPLHGICRNPVTPLNSFFGVSTQCQALLVLPALPHQETPERSSKFITPVNFLSEIETHQQSISIVRSSQCGQFLATGGIDGFVTLWCMKRTKTELLDRIRIHSGSVLDLCFSPDSTHVFSTSTDGTVMSLQLLNPRLGEEIQRVVAITELPRKPTLISKDTLPSEINTYVSHLAAITTQAAPPFDEKVLYSCEPTNQIVWREKNGHNDQSRSNDESDKGISKADLVHRVNNFKDRLKALRRKNNTLPDIEKLEPEDLLVDLNGSYVKRSENVNEANILRKELHDKCTNKELICARIVTKCQRSMEVLACEIRGLRRQELVLDNFALSKRDAIDVDRTAAICRIRALELKDIRRSANESSSATTLRTWKGLHNEVPNNVSWILNEGSHAPIVDVVSELKQKRKDEEELSAINGKEPNDGDFTNHNEFQNLRKSKVINLDISQLLYPPWALRTPRQIRTQIILLVELVREMRIAFNKHFQALRKHKEELVGKINLINGQLREILEEMGGVEEEEGLLLFEPKWYSQERIDDDELQNTTTEEKTMKQLFMRCHTQTAATTDKKKATNEVEKEALEKDNSRWDKEQALKHMMNGNPRIFTGIFNHAALPRPNWLGEKLGEAAAALTPEQENQVAIYEQAAMTLEENNQRRHMSMKLETRKLNTEINNLSQAFDDKVQELASMRLEVHQRIKAQELNIACMSMKLLEHYDSTISVRKLNESLFEANEKHNTCKERLIKFEKNVKIVYDKIKALEAHDRSLQMSFRKDIREAVSNPIDVMDMMPQLIQLYNLRECPGDDGRSGMENSTTKDGGGSCVIRGSFTNSSRVMGDRSFSDEVAPNSSRRNSHSSGSQKQPCTVWSKKRPQPLIIQSTTSNYTESFSTSSYAGGTELGPLQHAMKSNLARQNKPTISDKDPFAFVDKEIDRQRSQDSDSQCDPHGLEYPGFDVKDQVWNRLVELRAAKIDSEQLVVREQEKLHDLEYRLDILQSELQDAALVVEQLKKREKELIERALTKQKNIHLVTMLQQGQDEVVTDSAFGNNKKCGEWYEGAVLCPVGVVTNLNDRISELGESKINTLHQIKNITSSINLQRWKEDTLKAEIELMNQTCNDIQMLRMTRRLQSMMKKDNKKRNDKETTPTTAESQTSQTIEPKNISDAKGIHGDKQLQRFQEENELLEKRLCQLTESNTMVQRELIQSQAQAPSTDKKHAVTTTTASIKNETLCKHLNQLTKAQATEIQALSVKLRRHRERAAAYPNLQQNNCLKVIKLLQPTDKSHPKLKFPQLGK